MIEKIGTKTQFVQKDDNGNGYRFECDASEKSLAITEVIDGDSSVILQISFTPDGDLVDLVYYSTSYESELFVSEEIAELIELCKEDGVIAYDD